MRNSKDNKYTNNLNEEYSRKNKANASDNNFYQTLTLLGIGLILAGVYTVVIVLFSPIINASGSIILNVIKLLQFL